MPSENRPAPAVGQVWREECGREYVIAEELCGFVCVYPTGEIDTGFDSPSHVVLPTDTYVGQFRGFKVEGME